MNRKNFLIFTCVSIVYLTKSVELKMDNSGLKMNVKGIHIFIEEGLITIKHQSRLDTLTA